MPLAMYPLTFLRPSTFVSRFLQIWGDWDDLGGIATVSPAIERNDDGMLRVFIRQPDRAIYMRSQTISLQHQANKYTANATEMLWTNWVSLGGNTKAFQC